MLLDLDRFRREALQESRFVVAHARSRLYLPAALPQGLSKVITEKVMNVSANYADQVQRHCSVEARLLRRQSAQSSLGECITPVETTGQRLC